MAMIVFLLIPGVLYFLVFNFYATWNIWWSRTKLEQDNGQGFVNANNVMKWLSLAFIIQQIIVLVLNRTASYIPFHILDSLSLWNVLDIISLPLNLSVIICDHHEVEMDKIQAIVSVSVLIMWIKLFYYARIFSTFQTHVRLIIESVKDMIPFLFVFFIAILAFGNTYYILEYDTRLSNGELFTPPKDTAPTFPFAIIYSYREGIGQFDTGKFKS
jgi:hypothetical protein